jgi:nucleoside-diphosphate-sugar epimerase
VLTLVAGTGYTGRRVLEVLPANEALGLSRSAIDTARAFELVDFDMLEALPINLPDEYGVLYTCPPDAATDQRLRRFIAALPHEPTRFVYISTTGVYGDCHGAIVDLLRDWTDRLVVLRVPGIYGPGRLGIERLKAGEACLLEAEANPGNRIHIDDLVACCIAALSPETPFGVYNVGDGDYRTSTWFAGEVARQADLPAPREISRAQAAAEFSPMRLAFLASSRRVDTTKMREILGITPMTPEEGIRKSLKAGSVST